MSFTVAPVPAFDDNYLWVLRNGDKAVVVDPGDAAPVRAYLAREGLSLTAILVTHHHPDHIGGLAELAASGAAALPVYGPRDERISGITRHVVQGDTVSLPEIGARLQVLEVPGHTRSHIAYYGASSLFCGDTLFACGCGRLFEGTAQQMSASLAKFTALPDDTRVYCAHEYTLSNIRFARAVEPGNAALAAREARDTATRQQGKPTVPFTLADEKASNPFLRCDQPEIIASAAQHAGVALHTPVEVFAAVREWKNHF
jgi:hydroxyacylglutathione hydrolase